MEDNAKPDAKSNPVITEIIIKGKRYFHLTCGCGKSNFSVVHYWEKQDEWIERLEKSHGCSAKAINKIGEKL